MTRAQTLSLVEEWKAAIGLPTWTIRTEFAGRDLLGPDHGRVRWRAQTFPKKSCARIWILDPELPADPTEIRPCDLEEAVVHELLHCKLWTFAGPDGSVRDLIQETAIEDLARLLVAQKRQIPDAMSRPRRSKLRPFEVLRPAA